MSQNSNTEEILFKYYVFLCFLYFLIILYISFLMWMKPRLVAVWSEAKLKSTENCCFQKAWDFVKCFGLMILHGEKGIGIQPTAGSVSIRRNVPLRRLFKSSLNTAFHPHPFPLFLGVLKYFERHVKKENETCAALHWKEVLPLTCSRPWLQPFLAFARSGFKNMKKKQQKNQNPKHT